MAENDTDRKRTMRSDIDDTAAAPAYRMSRGRVALLAVLAILLVVLTALAQLFLPDSVPALRSKYWIDGDRKASCSLPPASSPSSRSSSTVYAVSNINEKRGGRIGLPSTNPVTSMFPVFHLPCDH